MNKRKSVERQQRVDLQRAGYRITGTRTIKMHTNPVDERIEHLMAKAGVGKYLAELGYKVDSEVLHEPTGNIADIVAYGLVDRKPVVVELESDHTEDLKRTNLEKYQHGPINEVYTLFVDLIPEDMHKAQDQFAKVLFG